jgi:hypothetical protein
MAKTSAIDKRIAELEGDIAVNQHAIAVLRSVQQKKVVKGKTPTAVEKSA